MKGYLIGLGVLALAALVLVLCVLFFSPFPRGPRDEAVVPAPAAPALAAEPVRLQRPEPDPVPTATPAAPDPTREGQAPPPLGGLEDGHVPPGVHPPKKDR